MSTKINDSFSRVKEDFAADRRAIMSGETLAEQVVKDEAHAVCESFQYQDDVAQFMWPNIPEAVEIINAKLVDLQKLSDREELPRELSALQVVLFELQARKVLEASYICEIVEQRYGIGSVSETRADALAGRAPEDKSQTIDECYETVGKIFRCLNKINTPDPHKD